MVILLELQDRFFKILALTTKAVGSGDKLLASSGKTSLWFPVFHLHAPTGKPVGSEKITNFGTDGFTRRSTT